MNIWKVLFEIVEVWFSLRYMFKIIQQNLHSSLYNYNYASLRIRYSAALRDLWNSGLPSKCAKLLFYKMNGILQHKVCLKNWNVNWRNHYATWPLTKWKFVKDYKTPLKGTIVVKKYCVLCTNYKWGIHELKNPQILFRKAKRGCHKALDNVARVGRVSALITNEERLDNLNITDDNLRKVIMAIA